MNTEETKVLPFTIKNFGLRSHMNMSNCGIRVDAGAIDWPGNPIDGKTFVREVYTPKKKMGGWGTGKATFYLQSDGNEKTPDFKTIEEFIDHYEIKKSEDTGQTPPESPRVKLKPEAIAKRKEEIKKKNNQ